MLVKIAWRNVWRNKLRSIVVLMSIVLGIWSGLFIMAMTLGLNEQRMSGAVNTYLSHIQIHDVNYPVDQKLNQTIKDPEKVLKAISDESNVKSYCKRQIANGMAASAKGTYGIQILGINPTEEKKVTTILTHLVQGTYFEKFKRNPVVLGEKLADKLGLKIKSKIILTFQNTDGDLVSFAGRVEGIFKTNSSVFDKSTIFVKHKDLSNYTGLGDKIHEIAILTNTMESVEMVKTDLNITDKNYKVESWDELSPELGYAQEMMGTMVYIFMGIILLALSFGIINTMLMAVLERKKELGMLMSVGMNKLKIFMMIVLETLFLAMIATPIGMLLAKISIDYFEEHGIDLSSVSQGLESFGIGSKIYTYLPNDLYFKITLFTLIVTLIASVFPARRALKLNPVEALRSL
jgi:ABC-type lipoprotein release transport system permease subunit